MGIERILGSEREKEDEDGRVVSGGRLGLMFY